MCHEPLASSISGMVPRTRTEYQKQRALLDELMERSLHKKDKHLINLLQLVARNLKIYEQEKFALAHTSVKDILHFLMEEHQLTQADLPEIGSQSLVSKVLSGKRKLTSEQIAQLAHRFHISPAVFY
jgi:HTH-type transcriptional regulator / antitoxin HigA